jgi:hypothetical protein
MLVPDTIVPRTGLDPSWILGLQMALERGLDFGSDVIFTYGPLSFLDNPSVAFSGLAVIAALYAIAVRVALGVALLWATRERFDPVVAFVLSLAIALITGAQAQMLMLTTVVALSALVRDRPRWLAPLVIHGGGAIAAVSMLVKLNLGLGTALITLIAVLGLGAPRLRNLGSFALSFVSVGLVLWVSTGQPVFDGGDYLRSSFEVIRGYSAAMSIDDGAVGWDLAAALVAMGALGAATAWTTRDLPRLNRLAALAVVTVLSLTLFKQGFVRHVGLSVAPVWASLAAAWVSLPWRRRHTGAVAAGVAVLFAIWFPTSGQRLSEVDPVARLSENTERYRDLLDPARRGELRDAGAERMRSAYALDPKTLALLSGHSVDIFPWEAGIAWAYDLDWQPRAVFQSYGAYTPYLDHRAASTLTAPGGPARVLRHSGAFGPQVSIDGRVTPFDSPEVTLAMLCQFRALRTTADYQVLAPAPGRCSERRPLTTVHAAWGESVPVPPAGPREAVIVTAEGLEPRGTERFLNLVYRAAPRRVILTIDGHQGSYRLAPAGATTGLLLQVPPRLDLPSPYNLAVNAEQIGFERDGGGGADGLTLRFYAVPLRSE